MVRYNQKTNSFAASRASEARYNEKTNSFAVSISLELSIKVQFENTLMLKSRC